MNGLAGTRDMMAGIRGAAIRKGRSFGAAGIGLQAVGGDAGGACLPEAERKQGSGRGRVVMQKRL